MEAPLLTRQALLEQAGVIAAANLGELLDAAALLAPQPVPLGSRVAVVSNTRGGGMLAADAFADAGLRVAGLAGIPSGRSGTCSPRCRGGRAGRYHRGNRARNLPSVP